MEAFVKASRLKLRFTTGNGTISTEQLWDLNLNTLIDYEAALTEIVESYGKSTRRQKARKTVEQSQNELRLEIVTYILDTREAEIEQAQNAAQVKEHNQKILDLIKRKQDQSLENMSVEELEKLMK